MKEITDFTFAADIQSATVPVLVDFWATWCGPCARIAPVLEELSVELEGKIEIVKLDVDVNPTTAREYHVMSIPTMILFKDGQPVRQMTGASSKARIIKELSEFI